MAPAPVSLTPGLGAFLKSLPSEPVENSIESFIALLKRDQIKGSEQCAIATAYLLRRLVSVTRASEPSKLIQKVRDVGRRLVAARPQELVVGNIVRRVLGLIRDEEDENRGESDLSSAGSDGGSAPQTPRNESSPSPFTSFHPPTSITPRRELSADPSSGRPPLLASQTGLSPRPIITSMFSMMSHPTMQSSGANSPAMRSGTATPSGHMSSSFTATNTDLRAEVIDGISEIIDELSQSDDQIASYALEHISPGEVIFTYASSLTVQGFLLKAASKRKFTVFHAEAYPNDSQKTHALLTGRIDSENDELEAEAFQKPLINAGITVILIPDSAVFAIMSRVNHVVLGAHAVLSNGSLIAAAGTKTVVKAAKCHHVDVIVLAGTYKLSPKQVHDPSIFIEYGNVDKVIKNHDSVVRIPGIEVQNPVYDFVDGEDIDLFVTNVGSVASGYLYRTVREQYRDEDADL